MKKFPVASVPRFFYGPWRLEMLPSVLWASAISFPQPPRALNYAQEYIASASSGAAFHKMQMENEQMKRRNDRQAKQIEELTAQIQQINSAMMANAGVGVPMSSRMPPNMPPAEPVAVAMPRAPSFAGAAVMDVQTLMINQHHPGATSRKGGWPKGKKRNLGGEAA